MSLIQKICACVLLVCCTSLQAGEEIAALGGGDKENFHPQERWAFSTENGKAVAKLKPKMTAYCNVPITGKLPEGGVIMLSLQLSGKAKPGTFLAGVGAWGSPTKQVIAEKDGLQTVELGFDVAYAKKFIKDGKIAMILRNSDSGSASPGIIQMSFHVPSKDKLLKTYRDYVAQNTVAAYEGAKKLTFVGKYDDQLPLNASTADQKRGFIPFTRNYMNPVYKKSVPSAKERSAAISVRLAKNETEPVQLAIKAVADLSDVTLSLKKAMPKGLSAKIYWVENVPLRTKGGTSSKNWHEAPNRLWPDALYPAPSIRNNEARAWYVIVEANSGAKAGKHAVNIAVKSGEKELHSFDLSIEILPFALPEEVDVAYGYYMQSSVSEEKIKNLAASGCNSTSAWPTFAPYINDKIDFSEWDKYFALLKKYKMDHSFLWYVGTKKQGFTLLNRIKSKATLIEMLKGIDQRVKSGKYPKNFYITLDEAVQNRSAFKSLKELAALMKEHTPNLKPFGVSLNRFNYTTQHKGFIDMLSCNGSFGQNEKWVKDNKNKMYTYTSFNARMNVGILRYNAGFNPWRYHADGTYGWAYYWPNGNPFNDMDSWGSDWIMVFPNWLGEPIGSPGMCGWREGIDDRRYLALLEEKVKAGKADQALLDELRGFLAADYHSEEKVVGDSEFAAILNDSEKLIKARGKIIDALLK